MLFVVFLGQPAVPRNVCGDLIQKQFYCLLVFDSFSVMILEDDTFLHDYPCHSGRVISTDVL